MTPPTAPTTSADRVPLTASTPVEQELAQDRWKMLGYLGVAVAVYLLKGDIFIVVVAAGIFASMLLIPFVLNPFALHGRLSLPRHPSYGPVDIARVAELPLQPREALPRMGFELVACLEKAPAQSRVTGLVALYVNGQTGDSAEVVLFMTRMRFAAVTCFNTRFADGGSLETSDAPEKPLYHPPPSVCIENRFPQVRAIPDLYRLHQALLREQGGTRQRVAATRDTVVAAFQQGIEEAQPRIALGSGFRVNAAGDRYVMTWAGAFRRGFAGAWPVPMLRRLALVAEEHRVLKRLGFRLDIGRLEPSGGS